MRFPGTKLFTALRLVDVAWEAKETSCWLDVSCSVLWAIKFISVSGCPLSRKLLLSSRPNLAFLLLTQPLRLPTV